MALSEIIASYIAKLNHPLKEIRERSLRLLIAKLRLGWELEDELSGSRQLLESLLAWFQGEQPTLQREALELLLATIRTQSGTYIAKEMGTRQILSNLSSIRSKIAPDAMEVFEDLVETLKFLNTLESKENVNIPRLNIPDLTSSESESGTSSGYYNLNQQIQTSKESSLSNNDYEQVQQSRNRNDGIRVLLFPWVDLCPSDSKTMLLIEDALRLLKSTRRCCRFIRDVFLRDFPAEIFLNRPGIIKNLLAISDSSKGNRPSEALHVLLCITQSLKKRLLQLSCLELVHESHRITDDHKEIEEGICIELEQIAEGLHQNLQTPKEDGLATLRQLPAPIYALDTLHAVLSIIARSAVTVDTARDSDSVDLKELNLSLALIDSLVDLLLDCVTEKFWVADHNFKTHRDISHKTCMVMRMLGDLLMKYRNSFYEDPERCHHRTAWLRLTSCSQRLLHWAKDSALPPSAMVVALQTAQIDPALELFYPELSEKISKVLHSTRTPIDQEYKAKYRQLKKLCTSMEEAVNIMKNRNSIRNTKQVYTSIKNSLPVLEIFQSEEYLNDIAEFILLKTKNFDLNDNDWSLTRSIALSLMASNVEWVSVSFYNLLADMVKTILIGDEGQQKENEKCLTLLCDVSLLTEICCHGLSSKCKEVEESASDIMLYLLRGRLVLSDSCWWRLLASLLPVQPLLHVYAAHDTPLGQAICKSLDRDIAECMGVSRTELISGLVRLLFVKCIAVQLDAAHSLCKLLDDDRYLPPRETLRADVLLNALKRVKPQDFNVDLTSSPSKTPQVNGLDDETTGLTQILDVLKQDVVLDEHGTGFVSRSTMHPCLEPSLRRNTLQQLSVMMRQQELHDAFEQSDGLKVIVAILRMSMTVDDYLAFPECALSCVSVLNSVCFASRHNLSKIPDLPSLLIRVILVFPANDSVVSMCAQILSLVAWAGFALQELDASRKRVPALPLNVTARTALPFRVNSYWSSSPNAEHSYVEWLLAEEDWRMAIRVHWWCANSGRSKVLLEAAPPPSPLALRPCARDLALLRTACPIYSSRKALIGLENATHHRQVTDALNILERSTARREVILRLPRTFCRLCTSLRYCMYHWQAYHAPIPILILREYLLCSVFATYSVMHSLPKFVSYAHLTPLSSVTADQISSLPWLHTNRFLSAPPASSRDAALLVALLHFVLQYMDIVPSDGLTMSWIKCSFIGNNASIIALLSRIHLYPQQTPQDCIEVIQVHIHIVKVLIRCIILLDKDNDYDSNLMESLLKILLDCLERVDLRNFHMLGYLNELMRCIRYSVNSRFCCLSEDTLIYCMKITTKTLSGCASGGGRKGQACRLDATLTLLALLKQVHEEAIPVQRWSEPWNSDVVSAIAKCAKGARVELRAAALNVFSSLAYYSPFLPHLLQAIQEQSLPQYAVRIFSHRSEANIVRAAAASLIAAIASRGSSKSDVLESDIFLHLEDYSYLDNCLDILVSFSNSTEYVRSFEPNISLSMLERRSELQVRAEKSGHIHISPAPISQACPPPSAALVVAIADVFNNLTAFGRCPVQEWNDRGLYRLLFRCASWSNGSPGEISRVRAATCRSLVAAASHKCVRTALAGTKDCLHNLLTAMLPLGEKDEAEDSDSLAACAHALSLVATLLENRSAAETVWQFLKDKNSTSLLHLILQCLESDESDLQDAALFCLTQLAQSMSRMQNSEKTQNHTYVAFYESLKSPFLDSDDRHSYGDGKTDCQPEYMAEELCKSLIELFQNLTMSLEVGQFQSNLDDRWSSTCSCLSSVLTGSARSRRYALHRQLPRRVAASVQAVRDTLCVRGTPADVIRHADHSPVLRSLYWLLTLATSSMMDCLAAKESFSEDNVPVSLNRLWPWCMMNDQLRNAVMHLLYNFTNDCPKAWAAMCVCVGGRSLIGEVCSLTGREAALQSRPRSDALLLLAIHTVRHCLPHHHCRALVLKSDFMSSLYKSCVRERTRGCSSAGAAWARVCTDIASYPEGAAAVLTVVGGAKGALTSVAAPLRAKLMPAVANAATHHRVTFLQSSDLLELLSGTLLTGDTAEVVSAARAVWALAANNHKAKLLLRSAGVSAAVQSTLQRLQHARADPATERALQLLTYTNTVLQTT